MKTSTKKCSEKRCLGAKLCIWKTLFRIYERYLSSSVTANVLGDTDFLKINSVASIPKEVEPQF